MSIKIVTDSTSDIPASFAQEYGITVIPVYINVVGQSFLDGIEISREEFYRNLASYKTPPTTSSPGIGSFIETYQQLRANGATDIISIHVASNFSNIFNVSKLAAQAIQSVKVAVVDSGSTSLALGFQALIAAKAAIAGKSVSEILSLVEKKVYDAHLFAALDTLEYLRRSGRASMVQASLGSLLNIKPVINLNRGKLTLENIRTRTRSIDRMISMVKDLGPLENLAIAHTNARERAEELMQRIKDLFPTNQPPIIVEATPALGTHVGPGALGLLCVKAG
jgi:DegV family protein with EDD domain